MKLKTLLGSLIATFLISICIKIQKRQSPDLLLFQDFRMPMSSVAGANDAHAPDCRAPCFSPPRSMSPPLLSKYRASPANATKPSTIFHMAMSFKKKLPAVDGSLKINGFEIGGVQDTSQPQESTIHFERLVVNR